MNENPPPKLLILGAHPDDAEYFAGGLATRYRQLGRTVKIVSVTDGSSGHHERSSEELVPIRRQEALNAGQIIGAAYETWDFPDARLQPTLEVRQRIICEIRQFQPDLVLTHRPFDYHPDHRAVGQAVQDASYLVTVPLVVNEVPALRKDPVIAYMYDPFTRPVSIRCDVVLDVSDQLSTIARMLACHRSQLFEWLAYEEGILDTVPKDETEKLQWVEAWIARHVRPRALRYRQDLIDRCGPQRGQEIEFIELFEISEYAKQLRDQDRGILFPDPL